MSFNYLPPPPPPPSCKIYKCNGFAFINATSYPPYMRCIGRSSERDASSIVLLDGENGTVNQRWTIENNKIEKRLDEYTTNELGNILEDHFIYINSNTRYISGIGSTTVCLDAPGYQYSGILMIADTQTKGVDDEKRLTSKGDTMKESEGTSDEEDGDSSSFVLFDADEFRSFFKKEAMKKRGQQIIYEVNAQYGRMDADWFDEQYKHIQRNVRYYRTFLWGLARGTLADLQSPVHMVKETYHRSFMIGSRIGEMGTRCSSILKRTIQTLYGDK